MKVSAGRSCFALLLVMVLLLVASALRADAGALAVLEWFPEPVGMRMINQPQVAGVLRNDSHNMDVTQTFTVTSSGDLSAVGFALGFPDGTPSLTLSLYRVSGGVVQAVPFATSFLPREYFENIGPQTIPIWAYAGFSSGTTEVTAGEKIAFRIQSTFAQLWGPRSDAQPGAELVGFPGVPGEDMAFRIYTIPEPAAGTMLMGSALCLLLASSRPRQARGRGNLGEPFRVLPS